MGWNHIPDNEEAWLYYTADLLYFGTPPEDMRRYSSPPEPWRYKDWMNTRFDGVSSRPNYIYLEE